VLLKKRIDELYPSTSSGYSVVHDIRLADIEPVEMSGDKSSTK